MKELLIAPQIESYESFKAFVADNELTVADIIFTGRHIYRDFLEKLKLPCHFIFRDDYGSGEPTDVMVDEVLKSMAQAGSGRLIAIGGGSILDIAKIMALDGAHNTDDLFETTGLKRSRELILIPTTCGTGSEVTNLSIINRTRLGIKMGLGAMCMYPDRAVLIPELTQTAHYHVFATSSIDALIHGVESFLSPKATDYTRMFSIAAIKKILAGYCEITRSGGDSWKQYAGEYLIASNYAGIAFGNAGCATVHAMSYAFGSRYHVPHGESNYQFFTTVLREYEKRKDSKGMKELIAVIDSVVESAGLTEQMGSGLDALDKLLENVLHKKSMSEYGGIEGDICEFAHTTFERQQRLLANSCVEMTEDDLRRLFAERL